MTRAELCDNCAYFIDKKAHCYMCKISLEPDTANEDDFLKELGEVY